MLYSWGSNGQQPAGSGYSYWARVTIKDLRYTQDTCSKVFSKSASHLLTHEERDVHKLRLKFGDDPDEVLQALRIAPEVVLHGEVFGEQPADILYQQL